MTPSDDLAELRAVAEKASPGEWKAGDTGDEPPSHYVMVGSEDVLHVYDMPDIPEVAAANARFIAAASPTRVLSLLDRLERAERERDQVRNTLALHAGDVMSLDNEVGGR